MDKVELISVFKGFRYLYERITILNNPRIVYIEDKAYYLPNDALKLRFELEFFWKKVRMTQLHSSKTIKVLISSDGSVIRFNNATK
jgi:hypothetical protein